jgi:hypothetical protein
MKVKLNCRPQKNWLHSDVELESNFCHAVSDSFLRVQNDFIFTTDQKQVRKGVTTSTIWYQNTSNQFGLSGYNQLQYVITTFNLFRVEILIDFGSTFCGYEIFCWILNRVMQKPTNWKLERSVTKLEWAPVKPTCWKETQLMRRWYIVVFRVVSNGVNETSSNENYDSSSLAVSHDHDNNACSILLSNDGSDKNESPTQYISF